ncbi:MAG: SDR family oxidoreductase [Pseudomonadota bacterium]
MQARVTPASALVFGGTGAVGAEILRGLAHAGVPTAFTYHRSKEKAETLAGEFSHRAFHCDLAKPEAIRALLQKLDQEGISPTVFIHCAAVSRFLSIDQISDDDWQMTHAVNCHSAFVACQQLAPYMASKNEGHVVLVGALDRSQSIPAPIHFAASQGMLSAMTMALAKELGPKGIRVNMVALGVLNSGLSRELSPTLVADYKTYSAMRRIGTPAEAAKAILWLALENTYMNGKVLSVNGGI